MKNFVSLILFVLFATFVFADSFPRVVEVLESDWKFKFGDEKNAQALNFDDSTWERVSVPYDWAIGKPFDMNIDMQVVKIVADGDKIANRRTGKTIALPCFGKGWYRKTIDIPNSQNVAKVERKILDAEGKIVANAQSENVKNVIELNLKNPKLWGTKTPNLYTLETAIFDKNGKVLDAQKTRFGVLSIKFSRKNGFELNGVSTQIQGVCMHHDMGAIGATTSVRALRRQLEILKEMGCNTIRTSHNPPSPQIT